MTTEGEPPAEQGFEALARLRFGIRSHLRFSARAVRGQGLTPLVRAAFPPV